MSPFMTASVFSPRKTRRLAPLVRTRFGTEWSEPSAPMAFTGNVVPTSAPEYTRNFPLGDHVGSVEYPVTSGTGDPPLTGILKRRGSPLRLAAIASHRASGDHAGVPRTSSSSATR